MPRKLKLNVEDFGALVAGLIYQLCVSGIAVDRRMSVLRVTFEHLSKDQEGRIHEVDLPLPVRPEGRTAAFFRACGMEVSVEVDILPEDTLGKIIGARFGLYNRSGDLRAVWFGPASEETRNEPKPSQPSTAGTEARAYARECR